jgi:acid-sensing ion channel, other
MQHKIKQSSGKSDKVASTVGENITQYLLSSSLHGLRYIGTASLSVFERMFFSLSFLMVVVLAAYFISNVYQKWKETPVKLNPLFFSCFNFSPKL